MKRQKLFDKVRTLYDEANAKYLYYTEEERKVSKEHNKKPDNLAIAIKLTYVSDMRTQWLGKMAAYVDVLELINKEDD